MICLEQAARGTTLYAGLNATDWAQGDRIVEYGHWEQADPDPVFVPGYDANGSVLEKITKETSSATILETITYEYNLQNRLSQVATTGYGEDYYGDGEPYETVETYVEYEYDCEEIRTHA